MWSQVNETWFRHSKQGVVIGAVLPSESGRWCAVWVDLLAPAGTSAEYYFHTAERAKKCVDRGLAR